jgi:hypothetical protein
MMKPKIIDGIWYESESGSSYHVLSEQVSRPKGPLSQRVPLDPPNGDPSVEANLIHLTPTMFLVFKTQPSYSQCQKQLESEIQLQNNNKLG